MESNSKSTAYRMSKSVLNTYFPVWLRNTGYSECEFTISRFSEFILSSKIKVVRLLSSAGFVRHSLQFQLGLFLPSLLALSSSL